MQGYRDLVAWKKAMELVTEIYAATRSFPKEELYGLVSQLRRAAVSIPSNLAEGYGRNSPNELRQFIGQARGSLAEVETQIEIAQNLGYLAAETAVQLQARVAHLGRMITGLRAWSERIAT
jgi:four helix bundle protein